MHDASRERLKQALLLWESSDAAGRESLLARLADEDPGVHRELESLVSVPTRAELTPSRMAEHASGALTEAQGMELPERIGPYRVLGVLGTGGMGVVYHAEQSAPLRREVALKLLRGGWDSARLLERFEAERSALARMDHPHIARAYDAGTDERGQPYVAMELVRGVPITRWCDDSRAPLGERVRLFVAVCRAVQHAHRRGVLHRDLKPSNILVTEIEGIPAPKVIDFGIARAVEASAGGPDLTLEGQVIGTPAYMSPEQASGGSLAVDTRSDVYMLGLVLYEMLSGRHPHDLAGLDPLAVLEVKRKQPIRPLTASPAGERLPADLVTIVHKSLETDPARRYEGASALADDLERWSRSEPIVARPASTTYQLRLLLRRHRVAAGTIALVAVLLVVFGVAMSVLYAAQSRERARAELEARKAEAVLRYLQNMLASADPAVLGREARVIEVVDRAAADVSTRLHDQPEVLAAALRSLGVTYRSLGRAPRSDSLLRAAYRLQVERAERAAEIHLTRLELARTLAAWAGNSREADSLARLVSELPPTGPEERSLVAQALTLRASLREEGLDAAIGQADRAAAMFRALEGDDGLGLASALHEKGRLFMAKFELHDAIRTWNEVLRIRAHALGRRHPDYIAALANLASCQAHLGNHQLAIELRTQVLGLSRELFGARAPRNGGYASNLGMSYLVVEEFEKARQLVQEAREIWKETLAPEHPFHLSGIGNMALVDFHSGRIAEAERAMRHVMAVADRTASPESGARMFVRLDLIELLLGDGRPSEAMIIADTVLAFASGNLSARSALTTRAVQLNAECLLAVGRPDRALSLLTAHPVTDSSQAARLQQNLEGRCLAALGQPRAADSLLRLSGRDLLRAQLDLPTRRRVLGGAARVYERWGDAREAARYRAGAKSLRR